MQTRHNTCSTVPKFWHLFCLSQETSFIQDSVVSPTDAKFMNTTFAFGSQLYTSFRALHQNVEASRSSWFCGQRSVKVMVGLSSELATTRDLSNHKLNIWSFFSYILQGEMQLHALAYCKFEDVQFDRWPEQGRELWTHWGRHHTHLSQSDHTIYSIYSLTNSFHDTNVLLSHWTLAHGLLISGFVSCHCHNQIILQF